jgi:hypothetical protein
MVYYLFVPFSCEGNNDIFVKCFYIIIVAVQSILLVLGFASSAEVKFIFIGIYSLVPPYSNDKRQQLA